MNNIYKIKVEHPLVRPGLTIETEASERYVTEVTNMLLKYVREINDGIGGTKRYITTNDGIFPISTEDPDAPKCVGDPEPITNTRSSR